MVVYPFPCSESPPRSCANYNITWHREHLRHEDRRGEGHPPSYSPSQQFLLSPHCSNDMSSCLYLCISVSPTPILKSTMWTLNIFPHLSRSLGAWSELLQVAAKHLALSWCIYTRHPGLASVWWPCPVCGPGVTCSWHRPIFEAPSPLPPSLRVASRRNRSAQPRARAGTFHSQPGWWLMMLNNLQFARDHSPGYKMPHCFSQSTFNKMQCGYFMIFLPSPHLSFKMGGT